MLPTPAIARLPKQKGGLSLPDLASFSVAMQAKTIAKAVSPGSQPWKSLTLTALARAAPHPAMGPSWVVTDLPLTAVPGFSRLSPRNQALVAAFRAAGVQPIQDPDDRLPLRSLLLMPLFYNSALRRADGSAFTLPDELPTGWPFTLQQLQQCPPTLRNQHPLLREIEAALPDRWQWALEVAADGDLHLRAYDEWWVGQPGPTVGSSYAYR